MLLYVSDIVMKCSHDAKICWCTLYNKKKNLSMLCKENTQRYVG